MCHKGKSFSDRCKWLLRSQRLLNSLHPLSVSGAHRVLQMKEVRLEVKKFTERAQYPSVGEYLHQGNHGTHTVGTDWSRPKHDPSTLSRRSSKTQCRMHPLSQKSGSFSDTVPSTPITSLPPMGHCRVSSSIFICRRKRPDCGNLP